MPIGLFTNPLYLNQLYSEIKNMSIKEYISLILSVLTNLKVIITVVVMLMVIEFARFVTNYRKKPRRPKVKKEKPAPAPKKEEKKEGDEAAADTNAEAGNAE